MRRKSSSYEDRVKVVKRVLKDHLSLHEAAKEIGTDHKQVRRWVAHFKAHGKKGLLSSKKRYPLSFKVMVVDYMRKNKLSLFETGVKFGILNESVIGQWQRSFENTDFIMAKSKRKQSCQDGGCYTLDDPQSATREELLKELEYARAENAFLKKLKALAVEEKSKLQE